MGVAASIAVLIALVTGLAMSTVLYVQAERQRLDAKGGTTDYITASKASGATAGLVGNAYIFYVEV